ncbi:MAG: GGDEF domain-containing protein [Sinobacteraceae bacterium]|nr:GGDEF domain-containing protein [Nevskiaceae bacterium]
MSHDLLNSVAATTTHRDRDELDRAVARLLLQFLELHSVTLLRLTEEGEIKRLVRLTASQAGSGIAAGGDELAPLPKLGDFPAWQQCALRNEIVQCSASGGRLMTVFPVSGTREAVGLLVLEALAPLSSRETDLVQGILGILRNHLALLDYGELDSLTGLLNRKTFESHFDKLRQRREGPARVEPSWLALIDIDRFKSINDGYGHLFGDEVLLLVSQLMRRSFRGSDQLFRFGGEEFVVLLDQASEPGAQIVLERLRASIEAYPFPQVGRVTISVGYTRIDWRDVGTTCVERADAALYYAKSHGRNNVQNCETLVAEGAITAKFKDSEVELF